MAYRIGELNRRLEIQAPKKVSDGLGGFTTTWSTIDTVWAAIKPLRGTEQIYAMQTTSGVNGRIVIRYRQNLRMSWRGKLGSRIFNFKSLVQTDDDKKFIEIIYAEQIG